MLRLTVLVAFILLFVAGCGTTAASPLDETAASFPAPATAVAEAAVTPMTQPAPLPTPQPTAAPVAAKPAVATTTEAGIVGEDSAESTQQPNPCLVCDSDLSTYAGPLTASEINGLLLALNDEYHAIAVYQQVLDDFGTVRPFSNIIRAERRHVALLVPLFETYGLAVPANPWTGAVPSFSSVHDACVAGVDAEVVNGALYNELFASTDRADILSVYQSLQASSINAHLPAFQRCAAR